MKNYREILIQFAVRILVAIPLFIFGWYLIASAKGGWSAVPQLFFAMGCFLGFAVIIAPPLARLFAEPAGSLHYPTIEPDRPQPVYSIPESKRREGLYEEAISEYEKIAKDFPDEVKPYIEIIDIAVFDLNDPARGESVLKKGLSSVKNDDDRDLLKIMHKTVTSNSK